MICTADAGLPYAPGMSDASAARDACRPRDPGGSSPGSPPAGGPARSDGTAHRPCSAHPAARETAVPDGTAARRHKSAALEPAWWTADPERWDLLRFEAAHDASGLPVDRWWQDRRDVLDTLILTPGPVDHDFARFLLDQETRLHRHSWGFSHTIEVAALLLAEHRRPDDVWHLWRAVLAGFDTWYGLPHRLLLAAGGTTRTIAYVRGSGHEQQDNLLGHLEKLAVATDDDVTALLAERRRHHTAVLRGLDDIPERDDER
ncbi:hypothetical protein ASE41_34595 [Streptomyces sp. Root264]|nr:hypothetical protein ASE41_34595 [Streptomyces sp. Root264]